MAAHGHQDASGNHTPPEQPGLVHAGYRRRIDLRGGDEDLTTRQSPRPMWHSPTHHPQLIEVVAFDLKGNRKWSRNIGPFISAHGQCLPRVVSGSGDCEWRSRWRGNTLPHWTAPLASCAGRRRAKTWARSYGTPLIRTIDDRDQMILCGSKSVTSHDPATGKRHWIIDGPTEQFVASMVYDGKHVFVTGGYPERHILAIRPNGRGNVTETHIAWRARRGAAYVPSPVVLGIIF